MDRLYPIEFLDMPENRLILISNLSCSLYLDIYNSLMKKIYRHIYMYMYVWLPKQQIGWSDKFFGKSDRALRV